MGILLSIVEFYEDHDDCPNTPDDGGADEGRSDSDEWATQVEEREVFRSREE